MTELTGAQVTGVMVTTRQPLLHQEYRRRGRVAPEHDQEMSVAPSIALEQGERGHGVAGPCERGPGHRPHTLLLRKGGDVSRVPVPGTGRAMPRRGANSHAPQRPCAQLLPTPCPPRAVPTTDATGCTAPPRALPVLTAYQPVCPLRGSAPLSYTATETVWALAKPDLVVLCVAA